MDDHPHNEYPPGVHAFTVEMTPDGPAFSEGASMLKCGRSECTKADLDHWIEFVGQVCATGHPSMMVSTPTGFQQMAVLPIYDLGGKILNAIRTAALHPEWAKEIAAGMDQLTRRYPGEGDHLSMLNQMSDRFHGWLPVPAINAEPPPRL